MTTVPRAGRVVRVLHLAMTLGCVIIAGILTALVSLGVVARGWMPRALEWVALPGVIVVLLVRIGLRRRMGLPVPPLDAWWAGNLVHIIRIWAIEEGVFLLGTVFWAMTGGPALLLLAGVGFALLLWDRPGRIEAVE